MANEAIELVQTTDNEDFLKGVELLQSFFTREKDFFLPLPNITDLIDDDTLRKVGTSVVEGYDVDWGSMDEWRDNVDEGRDLVKQEKESKSTPWDGASNFKSPSLMNAALKFSDRASTEILRQRDIVKTEVIGRDKTGEKGERADRVAIYSNYQVNIQMDEWREEHEKLLYDLPYSGVVFKKTFFDVRLGRNDSVLIEFPNFAVNQGVTSIKRLRRFSEIIDLSENEITERQEQGIWRDVDLSGESEGETNVPDQTEDDNFSQFIEQQGFYDLDGDGYQEPYTVVVHRNTAKVMRIIPRFEPFDVLVKDEKNQRAANLSDVFGEVNPDREVIRIKPTENITKYGFIRDPQGEFLDVGFYHLLGALTKSINSTTNQLVDAGTLANRASSTGWLAKGFRKKMGDSAFRLGQFKQTNLSAQDLQNGIRNIPNGEPSPTLFSLMTMMVASSQELSASADLSKSLGANAPATTTLALVQEQQQFTGAIILRLYRSMSQEFKKLFVLNSKFLDPTEYQTIVDDEEADFERDFNLLDMDISPVANPEISSKLQRIQLAEVEMSRLNEIVAAGGDPRPVVENFLRMIGSSNIGDIFPEMDAAQQLQELLVNNPELQELVTQQQQMAQIVAAAQQEVIEREQSREDAKTASQLDKDDAETKLKQAQTVKTLEEAETEDTKNISSKYTSALDIDRKSLENEALENANRQPISPANSARQPNNTL